jgi:hypothetical protein
VVWIGLLQGLGLGLVFVPISSVAYATLPVSTRTEAAGMFSLVRNIGSSIGISAVMTMLARGSQASHAELAARVPAFGAEQGLVPLGLGSVHPGWRRGTECGSLSASGGDRLRERLQALDAADLRGAAAGVVPPGKRREGAGARGTHGRRPLTNPVHGEALNWGFAA